MNIFWKNRYDKFIKYLNNRSLPICNYYETHHIHPKCLGGDNNDNNLIQITLREHFICHYMLAKTYNDHVGIVSAYIQMCHKNYKKDEKVTIKFKSRLYESLKTSFYNLLSEQKFDKVYCFDDNGNKVVVSKQEYKEGNYHHYMHNKVRCIDNNGNKVVVSKQEYKEGNYTYHTANKVVCYKNGKFVSMDVDEYYYDNTALLASQVNPTIQILDRQTQEIFTIKKQDWNKDPRRTEKIYNKLKLVKRFIIHRSKSSYNKDTFIVKNKNGKTVAITKDLYYDNKDQFETTTKGKKVVKTGPGEFSVVDKDVDLPGVTKGLTTVYNIETDQYEQVTQEYFMSNKHKFRGPATGKKNIRSIYKPGYYQVSRDYVQQLHETGPKKHHKVTNKITGDEMCITKDQWVDENWVLSKFYGGNNENK